MGARRAGRTRCQAGRDYRHAPGSHLEDLVKTIELQRRKVFSFFAFIIIYNKLEFIVQCILYIFKRERNENGLLQLMEKVVDKIKNEITNVSE